MKRRYPEPEPEDWAQQQAQLPGPPRRRRTDSGLTSGESSGGERAAVTGSSDEDSDGEGPRMGFGAPVPPEAAGSEVPPSDPLSSKYSMYNSVSQKLMMKMGYREGEGLGKFGQGRKEIVEASLQRGRRGLGLKVKGFDGDLNIDWQVETEPSAYERVEWFPECSLKIPNASELREWMCIGQRKMEIEDETEFCDGDLLRDVLRCKSVFDELEGEEMRRARTRSNPFETIRGVFFLNRAAMKMANMDHVFDYMFTNPRDSFGHPLVRDKDGELLYFADVCAGPGGFSEYVLWRKRWHAKGFGLTLRGPNDFKLEDFFAASSEFFEPYYGEGGVDGDGDITRPENITEFRRFVLENTDRRGVHFLMADGGFSVEGQENLQEILSKQLLLCQVLVGLSVIRTGGHFVCKTFDLFTPFSAGLIYLLFLCFERVSLFKPITSRPANSERYIVCRSLREGTDVVRDYLFTVNVKLNQLRGSDQDVTTLVPLAVLKAHQPFSQHLCTSNQSHAVLQIKALAKIHAFIRDPNLNELRQADLRKECLTLWGIPDKARVAPSSTDPRTRFLQLIQGSEVDTFGYRATPLTTDTIHRISQLLNYRCLVAGGEQYFLLGAGVSLGTRKWGGHSVGGRDPVEKQGEVGGVKSPVMRILDVGGDGKIRGFDPKTVKERCTVRAESFHWTHKYTVCYSVKEVYRLEDVERIFVRLEMKVTKGSGGVPRLSYTGRDDRHFLPTGLHVVKTVNDPWTMAYSRNTGRKYFYNTRTQEASYQMPPDSVAPFTVCHQQRLFWTWAEGVRVHDCQTQQDPSKLSKDDVLSFIQEHHPI
ncbi:cap-specific mRNA (nucleoside-2'-O-)-methyltransferase 1 [Hypanus sabinus]|uniref:cap-specific mRNA (nucleoside-2'-O-)-methyltransferase 1 n=1 Tax=Hypanus sabinus TaxID=79690 RepID=UPI0028C4ADB1|nr:cap-specific mRNA (nucleoside-2'-O-)-methyltransferase 1 [Hypanus sabinus]